jgi:hypothetical protein
MAFLVAGLALTVAAGVSASDQFAEDMVFNGAQIAELPAGLVVESSEPSFIEEQGYIAAIEAAAAAEWAMSGSSAPDVIVVQYESVDMEPSALVRESVDVQPTPRSDQALDLRALLNAREAEFQSA